MMKLSSFTFRVDSERFYLIILERTRGKNTKHAVGVNLYNENGYIGNTSVDSCNAGIVPTLVAMGAKAVNGIYRKGVQVAQIEFCKNTIAVKEGDSGKEWALSDEELDRFFSAYIALGGYK